MIIIDYIYRYVVYGRKPLIPEAPPHEVSRE
jgi:hypothetical protein